tara:strand:+ start:3534 stop:4700 length:1167 start_codon:yes stop_codon:yes gene_type:complete
MNWKNLITNRLYYSSSNLGYDTSIFSMIGMGVGCFAMIIALSVLNGFESFVHKRLRGFESDLNITGVSSDTSFFEIPEIEMVMPYMERKAIIKGNKDNLIVTIKAIADILEDGFYEIPHEGNFPQKGHVIIGKTLAKRIGKGINDELTLLSPIDQVFGIGFPPYKKMKISGVFSTKVLNYDDSYLFISLADGESFFRRKSGIDGYDIKLYDTKMAEIVKKKLYNLMGQSVKIKSWKEKNKSLVKAMELERKASIFILGLIFLVASFNLSSSLILLSIKKLKEVGILKVLGVRKNEIMYIMIFLGVKTALKGALVGLAVGFILVLLQNHLQFIPLPSKVYFINYLPMKLDLIDFSIVLILVSSFIFLSSYFAAKKVANKNLKEALEWVK